MKLRQLFSIVLLLGYGLVNISMAQEESEVENSEAGSVQVEMAVIDGDGLGGPMVFSTTTESFGDGMPPRVHIMAGDAIPEMGFVGSPLMTAPEGMSLLSDASVQKDLELVDDQIDKLRDMQREFGREMKEQIGDLTKGDFDKDRIKDIGALVTRLRETQKSQMEQLLLPHQLDRLKQVRLQRHMEAAGTAGALGGKIAEELGITAEQKQLLKEREQEIKQEMAEKMAKLREEAREELLEVLNPTQREKLKQMIGEKFKSEPQDWSDQRQRFRRGGPRKMKVNGS